MQNEKIADKLRKLMTLASRASNPGEAAAAFAQAQAMATKHRIELASLDTSAPEDTVSFDLDTGGKRVMGWRKILLPGTCTPQGVYCILMSGEGVFTLAGKRGDIDTALYLYHAIAAEIERLARGQSGQGRSFVNAFKVGAAATVVKRLAAQHASEVAAARSSGVSETALVFVDSARDDAARWWRKNNLKPGNRVVRGGKISSSSADGRAAGRAAGQGINIGGNAAIGKGARALGA